MSLCLLYIHGLRFVGLPGIENLPSKLQVHSLTEDMVLFIPSLLLSGRGYLMTTTSIWPRDLISDPFVWDIIRTKVHVSLHWQMPSVQK